MLMTVRCFAYDYSTITGTKASGAEISGYSGALEVNVLDFGADKKGKKDSSKAIQKALDYAIDNGSNSVQIKVVVPKGKYRIDKLLEIYSNTWLYLEDGATIVRNFDKGCMIKNARKRCRRIWQREKYRYRGRLLGRQPFVYFKTIF